MPRALASRKTHRLLLGLHMEAILYTFDQSQSEFEIWRHANMDPEMECQLVPLFAWVGTGYTRGGVAVIGRSCAFNRHSTLLAAESSGGGRTRAGRGALSLHMDVHQMLDQAIAENVSTGVTRGNTQH